MPVMTNESPRLTSVETAQDIMLGGLHCRILPTADGSFSLCYGQTPDDLTEPMHSSKGAWSETMEIYEPALRRSLEFVQPDFGDWRVASIGLGLGYNEILSAGIALQQNFTKEKLKIISFESRPELRESFRTHFTLRQSSDLNPALSRVYQNIVDRTANHLSLSTAEIYRFITELLINDRLVLKGSIQKDFVLESASLPTCSCILFDAFSPASSPDLWTEDILAALTETLADRRCVFVSYASRTLLKKVLRQKAFRLEKRSGFAGKRESTFAIRK
jgi:tRNA U34 5-methylaminomethyl-2-thiouridine-forming methyltransferase MnmC